MLHSDGAPNQCLGDDRWHHLIVILDEVVLARAADVSPGGSFEGSPINRVVFLHRLV